MLMVGSVRKIDFDDLTEALPAFACIALMVFTYNIANGLTAGLVLYPLAKLAAGRARELNWGSVVLGALCLTYFLFGLPH
jgi:AGZA family xanthine/uracil permease-like MFS transporter